MGFGILLIGYALTISGAYRGVDIPPALLAYGIMLIGLYKLSRYCSKLKAAYIEMFPLAAVALLKLILQIIGLDTAVMSFVLWAEALGLFVFYILLLWGIRSLSLEVGLPKLAGKAVRNLVITAAFYIFTLFTNLYNQGLLPQAGWLPAGTVFLVQQAAGYLLRGLILVHIGSCYRRICLEGDEDMPYEPSEWEKKRQKRRK